MSSRRMMNRSLSSDGRSYYSGSDMGSQNRRAGSRSYLSSVRSESRSTLCSVMAQITEDIQPTFESTLKSKAVSEETNVKFSCVVSGHPAPEVTWYKDDIQLDRYCGLPKYEISRDDKTHTLQIYNCTLDDAAIYQASAQNSRGIVSCSGVLEVGTMSEYKIHQNYFTKLKLRNENRRREQEEPRNTGKENIPAASEAVRMSSPERAQWKRRCPVDSSRRAGSPLEERHVEVDGLGQTTPLEDRLAALDQTSVAVTVQSVSNAEVIKDKELKKDNISTAATERSKENRTTGRREEMMNETETLIEKIEVQSTDAQFASVAESDSITNKKQPENVKKSGSEESKRAQGAQITSMTESKNKMDITDTKMNKKLPIKVNKSVSEDLKRGAQTATETRNKIDIINIKNEKQSVILKNKCASEEVKRNQFASLTKTTNRLDITDTRKSEKKSLNVNKSTSGESKRDQSVDASVTDSRNKMDVKDTKTTEKLYVNKSASEDSKRAQGPRMASVFESRNKLFITDQIKSKKQPANTNKHISEGTTKIKNAQIASVNESRINIGTKTIETTSLKTNKSALEESKINQDVQMPSVPESRHKMDMIDTRKTSEKWSMNANKSVSTESKVSGVQINSETESSNKIKDIKTNTEKLLVQVNKKASEESEIAQKSSVTEYRNKMDLRDTTKAEKPSVSVNRSVSEDSKKVTCAEIASLTESKIKLDIPGAEKIEKQSETRKESASEVKRAQKPVSMTTMSNEVVEITKLTKPPGKGTSNFKARDTIQNCNPVLIDNKLKGFDDHRNSNPVGTCMRILPNSCGGNDVNVDTGERNASARSLRGLAVADTHTEPTEPPIREDAPPIHKEVALELKEQPTSMREVTVSVKETLNPCHLASQEQKLRAGDQSVASTKSNTLVPGPQNTQLSEKISSGHVSHKLQGGQVTSSSLGDDTLSNMCEEDSKDKKQLIKESDELKSETKSASMSSNDMEEIETKSISTDVHVVNPTSEEKSTANSQHSKNQVIVTDFVQICISKPQYINGSSVSDVQMKDTNAQDCAAKESIKEQSNVKTSEEPISTHLEMQSRSVKKGTDGTGPSTFLYQHSKALSTEFTIPAIYITDVDNTQKAHTADAEIRNEPNAATFNVRNNNTVNGISDTSDSTYNANKNTSVQTVNFNLSLDSQPTEFNSQENVAENVAPDSIKLTEATMQHRNADKSIKTDMTTETSRLTKTDFNLRNNSESFVKQLKEAALDLEKTNQPSIKINAAQNMNSIDNVKYGENTNLAETQHGSFKQSVPLKNTDDQGFSSTAAHNDLSTRTEQKTTFPKTTTEKSDIKVAACLEKANRDTYHEDKLSLNTQPASPSQSISNLPLTTSLETHSPRLSRRTVPNDPPKPAGNKNINPKSTEKDKENQFKVPQVIRKIRPEVFDASGHLKLWCQFFNIVSDSTIRWYKDEVEMAEINRSAGDETQLCLAIIQMSKRDCGVYRCTITNEYGKDSTEYLLSTEFLSNMFVREEHHEVGEEIEMTPLIFSKGLADSGCWGSKFYGRVTTEEAQVGLGCEHKTRRVKVIYGLDPVFESGSACFMKVRSPIAYESREETVLAERNLQITKQDCRIQNMAREYFKIFATETRMIESFGAALEVIPLYFTYWPASSVPYATVEAELKGVYLRYCGLDRSGSLVFNEKSDVGQKCSALQHWIHQWTNGNVLFSRLEGVETILTNIGIAVRSKGYQGFPCEANPKVFDQFLIQHQCNYFCGLLNLRPLKATETLQTPARSKGSSSPLPQRRAAPGSSSPQAPRKTTKSPKVSRKVNPQTST